MEGVAMYTQHTIYHKRCYFKLSWSFFGPSHSIWPSFQVDESWERLLNT